MAHRMACRLGLALCVAVLKVSVASAATQQQVADYVRDAILGGNFGSVNLWMTDTALGTSHVARDPAEGVPDLAFPYAQTWLVMIDDAPEANWGHPCRWLFVNDNLLVHTAPLDKNWYPTVWANFGAGPQVEFFCRPVTPNPCGGAVIAAEVAPLMPADVITSAADMNCLHAVLISGGWDSRNNHIRYRQNLRSMYRKLRDCGYPAANICVYYADPAFRAPGFSVRGNSLDLDNADGDNNDDTGNDVTGAASEAAIRGKIQNLCMNLDPKRDVLLIYVTNHGMTAECKDAAGGSTGQVCGLPGDMACPAGSLCLGRNGIALWDRSPGEAAAADRRRPNGMMDDEDIYEPDEFAADTANCRVCRLFIIMDQCYSGMFTSIASDGMHGNSAIYTAARRGEPSYGREYMARWERPANDPETTDINDLHDDVVMNGGLTSTPTSGAGAAGNGDISMCYCWKKVIDCVGFGNPETFFGPGVWTIDGQPIGTTFPNGVGIGGGERTLFRTYDCMGLRACPNDWHWWVQVRCQIQPTQVFYWIEGWVYPHSITVPVVCSNTFLPPGMPLHVKINIGIDQYMLSGPDMIPLFTAPFSGYPGNLPPGFFVTGDVRRNYIETPANDECAGAIDVGLMPALVSGDTSLATPEIAPFCGSSLSAPGIWYSVLGTGRMITAETCPGADYDTKVNVYCGACSSGLACVGGNDDACGPTGQLSSVSWCSAPGQRYDILVQGFGGAVGSFTLSVTQSAGPCVGAVACVPCLDNPPGWDKLNMSFENELGCGLMGDTIDGGCNSAPPVFVETACARSYQGTAGATNTVRDTDWYQIILEERTEVTWSAEAEFPLQIGIINNTGVPDCAMGGSFLLQDNVGACVPASVTSTLNPGTWWLFAAPGVLDSIPCGATYRAVVTCIPRPCPADLNGDGAVGSSDLALLLGSWSLSGPADLDGSGSVGSGDLALLLGSWGPCI